MKRATFSLGIGLVVFSCGIFSPEKVEEPSGDALTDPLGLSSILIGTDGQFQKKSYDYEDVLGSNFQFIAWDNAVYSREDMVENLNNLRVSGRYSIAWDTCQGIGEIRDETNMTMTLCRTFFVKDNSNNSITDTGKVEFLLNQLSVNIWTIGSWRENLKRSIFHP